MNAEELRIAFKELIEKSEPLEEYDDGSKSFELVHQLINQCGYEIRAEQRGISGTYLSLYPTSNLT